MAASLPTGLGVAPASGRNIVLCCDGTSNEYGDRNSNVVKLFSMLRRGPRQLGFYDPGVGTLSAPAVLTGAARIVTRGLGLAFGLGITKNIEDAYAFLMETWQPGDRVFIFGFSRGAYTARAVAAMLHKVGLLDAGSRNLLPYASKMFKQERNRRTWAGFSQLFGRACPVHFLGLWDTVTSVGWVFDPFTLAFTAHNDSVRVVRHAISIDERRAFFRQNLWAEGVVLPDGTPQDVKQVWFAGCHSDVGGSYPERESGLSQIALEWMADEAVRAGLDVDPAARARILPPPGARPVAQARPDEPEPAEPPDYTAEAHESLSLPWWIAEFYPKVVHVRRGDRYVSRLRMNLFRTRYMPEGSVIHESVKRRLDELGSYQPSNLPRQYGIEPWPSAPPAPKARAIA